VRLSCVFYNKLTYLHVCYLLISCKYYNYANHLQNDAKTSCDLPSLRASLARFSFCTSYNNKREKLHLLSRKLYNFRWMLTTKIKTWNTAIKSSPYSIAKRRVPVLGSQPAGDVSHKPGSMVPLLSARPAVILATLKRAATSFSASWTEAQWMWTVCLKLLPDSVAAAIWTQALLRLSPAR